MPAAMPHAKADRRRSRSILAQSTVCTAGQNGPGLHWHQWLVSALGDIGSIGWTTVTGWLLFLSCSNAALNDRGTASVSKEVPLHGSVVGRQLLFRNTIGEVFDAAIVTRHLHQPVDICLEPRTLPREGSVELEIFNDRLVEHLAGDQ